VLGVDTGCAVTVFPPELIAKISSDDTLGNQDFHLADRRRARTKLVTMGSVSLGPVVVPYLIAAVLDRSSADIPTAVGVDVLARTTVLLDAPGKALYVRPTTAWNASLTENDRKWLSMPTFGIILAHTADGSHWTVASIGRDCPSQVRNALRVGDELVAVGDQPTAAMSWTQVWSTLKAADHGLGAPVVIRHAGEQTPVNEVIHFGDADK
jgi:hypothetical protein